MADAYPELTAVSDYRDALKKQIDLIMSGESVTSSLLDAKEKADNVLDNIVGTLIKYASTVVAPKDNKVPQTYDLLNRCDVTLRTSEALKARRNSADDFLFKYDESGNVK